MIPLKSEEDLEFLRRSGKITASVLKRLQEEIVPGMRTSDIDRTAESLILKADALPAFKGYRGFPATLCASVNEEIVHGIPGERVLCSGDIISIDIGVNYKGYFTDAAVTVPVGRVSKEARKLIKVARDSLTLGIKKARSGNRLFDISNAIQEHVEKHGFSVVRQFVGHGIGKALHEEPEIPNFGPCHEGPELKSGMVLAVEPMINMGTWECEILGNGWTAVTKDRLASAHFEHTIAVTNGKAEILTR